MAEKTASHQAGAAKPFSAKTFRRCLLALFAASGAAGLIYEIVWVRQFTLVLGASTDAVTIVLAVFMAGLGIGAWLLGKVADRFEENGLVRCYVLLEIGIALYGLLLPLLLHGAQSAYAAFHQAFQPSAVTANALCLLVAFLLLIVPTTLMGATLPVLSRYLIRAKSQIPVTVSQLYGWNTLGALLGTVAAGYVLLPELGVWRTSLVAIGINFLVAAAFWAAHRVATLTSLVESLTEAAGAVAVRAAGQRRSSGFERAVVAAFALSGFAAMVYEVAWTRTLSMILGTTTFSFTTMLATFLLGIALGSMLFRRLQRLATPINLLIWMQYLVAFSALATLPLFEKLPVIYLSLHGMTSQGWMSIQLLRFALAALVILVPTFAMGVTFPAVSALFVENTEVLGRRLGTAYGCNTLGAVLGVRG